LTAQMLAAALDAPRQESDTALGQWSRLADMGK